MPKALKMEMLWSAVATVIFIFFYWLFGVATPGAELAFTVGTTIIIMSGLLIGRYVVGVRKWTGDDSVNKVLLSMVLLTLFFCFLIGYFINKMIDDTRFHHFFFTIISLFMVCTLISAQITIVRIRIRDNLNSAKQALVQSKTELQLLQSQLSPHFLFNTLNNLYGLSMADHARVPPLLLQLSDLLRYSVYEAKDEFVSLKEEVQYIRNYIEFEKLRIGKILNLSLQLPEVIDTERRIAPMLLIVFIENAFKHSKNDSNEEVLISISLKTIGENIFFEVYNSMPLRKNSTTLLKKHSGFGLDNVRKRLNLLYTDRHSLQIQEKPNSYHVKLTLRGNEY